LWIVYCSPQELQQLTWNSFIFRGHKTTSDLTNLGRGPYYILTSRFHFCMKFHLLITWNVLVIRPVFMTQMKQHLKQPYDTLFQDDKSTLATKIVNPGKWFMSLQSRMFVPNLEPSFCRNVSSNELIWYYRRKTNHHKISLSFSHPLHFVSPFKDHSHKDWRTKRQTYSCPGTNNQPRLEEGFTRLLTTQYSPKTTSKCVDSFILPVGLKSNSIFLPWSFYSYDSLKKHQTNSEPEI
jgi:hypothetical protein